MTRTIRLTTFARPSVLLAAQHRGFLEQRGITLEIEDATGSRPQMEGLLSGRWDIAHTNADNVMKFRAFGHDGLFVFLVVDRGIAQKLVVQPQVQAWEDLRGRQVGVDAPDSGYAFVLYELLRRHGLERTAYDVVPLGATAYRLKGLRRGEVAAGLLSHHHEAAALDDGFRVLADTRENFPDHPGVTAATTRAWAAGNDDVLAGYAGALLAAARWVQDPANIDDVVRLVSAERGIDADHARRVVAIERAGRTGTIGSVEDAARSLAAVAELRMAVTGAQPTGYFVDSAMRAAFAVADRTTR